MTRPKSAAALAVEVLEAREVPAFGLDASFAAGGFVLDAVAPQRMYTIAELAAGPGNTLVTAGNPVGLYHPDGYPSELAVIRFTADGKADTSFGGGDGVATFVFDNPHIATSVAVRPDGKILVAGTTRTPTDLEDAFVLQLKADGTRDAAFGKDGEVVFDLGGADTVDGISVQSDGKVVLAGTTATVSGPRAVGLPRLAVARLTAAGALDNTFDGDGKAFGPAESIGWYAAGVAVRPDGKIVVGGAGGYGNREAPGGELAVAQFTPAGALDSGFGTGGVARTSYGAFSHAYAGDLALLADGRVVLTGGSTYGPGLLAWFDSTGGIVSQEQTGTGQGGGLRFVTDVVAAPGGGVYALGYGEDQHRVGFSFEHRTAPGTSAGTVTLNLGNASPYVDSAVLGADGKVSVVAFVPGNSSFDPYVVGGTLALARFSDPGVTSGSATLIEWLTPKVPPPGEPVNLVAAVTPLLGTDPITDGRVTYKEGDTVLGVTDLAAVAGLSPWEVGYGVRADLPPGRHTITAEFSGSSRWSPASVTRTFLVADEVATVVELTVSDPLPGGWREIQARVSRTDGGPPPNFGEVRLYSSDTLVETWLGYPAAAYWYLSPEQLTPGTHALRAVFPGTPGYLSAESNTVRVTVAPTQVATQTALTVSAATPVVGAPFTFTATVRDANGLPVPAGGLVTFTTGGTVVGTATVGANGVATTSASLQLGTRTVKASYLGGSTTLASDAAPVTVTVGRVPTATELTASTKTPTPGQSVTLTANVRTTAGSAFPIGTVEFRAGTRVLGTAALDGRGQAKLVTNDIGVGSQTVTAVYVGCSTCQGSTSPAVTVTSGGKAATTTTLTAAVAAPVFGQTQTLTARVAGATGGRVDFFDGAVGIGSAEVKPDGTASLSFQLNLGARRFRAVFAGTDATGTSASGWLSQTVAKATPTVSLWTAADGLLRAEVKAPHGGSPIGSVTFKSGNTVLGTARVNGNGVAALPANRLSPGTHQIVAAYSGSSCFLGADSGLLRVTISTPSIRV